jgi:hypothetical protein
MSIPPPPPKPPPTDWWVRNWKWFIPCGGAAFLLGIGAFTAAIFGWIKSSDAYSGALARARSSPSVIAALGTPIRDGFFVMGKVSITGTNGEARFAIPVAGPKGAASIFVQASKSLGVWHYDHMIVQLNATARAIDLSEPTAEPGTASP